MIKIEDNRLLIWLNFIKFVIGAVIFGLLGSCINQSIQEKQLELQEMVEMGKFVQYALSENIGTRHRLAEYFSAITVSDSLREKWEGYYKIVHKEYAPLDVEYSKLSDRYSSLQNEISKLVLDSEAQKDQNKELLKMKSEKEDEINVLLSKLNELQSKLIVKPSLIPVTSDTVTVIGPDNQSIQASGPTVKIVWPKSPDINPPQ